MADMHDRDLDIAVIGMAGRFPGARSISDFWRVLCEGVNATQRLEAEQLVQSGVPESEFNDPRYVPVWAGLDDVDLFDAAFFGYSPAEAELMDPQQRVFLECAWEALEDAGHDPARFPGDIAVYAATSMNLYLLRQILADDGYVRSAGQLALALGNDKDNLSTRVSYKLGLTGPSVTVQSNCSSGMVALHHAIGVLQDGQSDMAIVGAVSIKGREPRGYLAEAGGISSASGEVRAFDARADGHLPGDAVAALIIRRFNDAVRDGDHIYAIIRGTAICNDGSAKIGYAAPSKAGQIRAISRALALARVDPDTVYYVEAHGSATLMGDAMEVAALEEAYHWSPVGGRSRLIGTVKPNFGNLDTVSGLASLMKAVLALSYGQLPPTIQYEQPNPQTSLGRGPIRVNNQLRSWDDGARGPRRAGVNCIGVGGTNVHAILEAPPVPDAGLTASAATRHGGQLILVSARTPDALGEACRSLARHLESRTDQPLADVAYTSQVGRHQFAHRAFVVASLRCEAIQALLADLDSGSPPDAEAAAIIAAVRDADPGSEDHRNGLMLLGRLWCAGAEVPWSQLHEGAGCQRVSLPAYPFSRARFWHEPARDGELTVPPAADASAEPGAARPATISAAYVAPSGLIQEAVAQVWCRRLGLDRIGVNDSFLEMGGDSLVAARIANEVAESFHVEANLRAFLETPTIASMASLIDEQLARGAELRSLVAEMPEGAGEQL